MLRQACEKRSKKLEFSSLSEPVSRYLELFNLTEVFSLATQAD